MTNQPSTGVEEMPWPSTSHPKLVATKQGPKVNAANAVKYSTVIFATPYIIHFPLPKTPEHAHALQFAQCIDPLFLGIPS